MAGKNIMEKLQCRIETIVHETIDSMMNEGRVVLFGDGKVYPRFGWCVIMAGGCGSGKGYTLRHQLPIDGKLFNVDSYKRLYQMGQRYGFIDDPVMYDTRNPDDVETLHKKIKSAGWKRRERDIFFKAPKDSGRLPNVIFDITGSSLGDVREIIGYLKPLGYKIMFVWTVTNRSVALFRNLVRKRVVAQNVFHEIHNKCNVFIPAFLKGDFHDGTISQIDDAWLVFGSSNTLQGDNMRGMSVKLIKKGDRFVFPKGVEKMIERTLGPQEMTPSIPSTYLDNASIRKKMYPDSKTGKWKTDEIDFLRH